MLDHEYKQDKLGWAGAAKKGEIRPISKIPEVLQTKRKERKEKKKNIKKKISITLFRIALGGVQS